jgi:hypothetical protein
MTITTAQSVSSAQWGGGTAGSIVALRQTGPQQTVSPAGMTAVVGGLNRPYAISASTSGVIAVTAGFDPSIVFALTVKLRTTGQIWPVGYS